MIMSGEEFVCCDCIGDVVLTEILRQRDIVEKCSYCEKVQNGEQLDDIASRVDEVYRAYYGYGESLPVFHGDSDEPDYEQQGDFPEEIIDMMIKPTNTDISSDICSYLANEEAYFVMTEGDDAMYNSTSCYQHIEVGAGLHFGLWNSFCEDIKHGARFFSLEAHETLSQVFKDITSYASIKGLKPIRLLPVCEIYRSRKANSLDAIKKISSDPEKELDAPPKDRSVNGRMNPIGVPIFYGAFDKDTCIAELRPAVGEKIICGTFILNRPLKVFDFTVLNQVYKELSMFDPNYAYKLSQLEFLKNFESIVSRAFLPSETDLAYLPLQATTEYLSRYVDGGVDGIIYSSAQTGCSTKNIAVFNSSNRVKVAEDFVLSQSEAEPFLTFKKDSITLHEIEAVTYKTKEHYIDGCNQEIEFDSF